VILVTLPGQSRVCYSMSRDGVSVMGIAACGAMIDGRGWANWLRLVVWLVIGLVFYFGYGRTHSRLEAQPERMADVPRG
jgi:APA family basic amino acid/polyamine antiporter